MINVILLSLLPHTTSQLPHSYYGENIFPDTQGDIRVQTQHHHVLDQFQRQ